MKSFSLLALAALSSLVVNAQRVLPITAFNELNLKGSANVTIRYGTKNEAEITGETESQKINIEQSGKKISISTVKNKNASWGYDAIKVTLYTTELNTLALSGSGNVLAEGEFLNNGTVNFSISGSGNVTASVTNADDINILVSGSGNVNIKAAKSEVSCNNLNVMLSGSGNIQAVEILASEANVKVSGSGNATINATKTINAAISGSGNVRYKGSPSSINEKSSHKNSLKKIE